MVNLAVDSKLRVCDLVALRFDDVAPNGYAIDRAKRPARNWPGSADQKWWWREA
jgi:hypothetical protein